MAIEHLELQVPSWTTGHSQGEDNVVFYAIDVRVTLAGANDDSGVVERSTVSKTVQRRFSDFRRLYDMLCMLYGHDRVPPILPVEESRAQSQSDVIGARREALDKWVRVLAVDEAVGRSPQVTAFLQLDKSIKEKRRRRGSSSSQRSSASAPGDNEASGSGEDELVGVKAFLALETAAKELLAAKVAELENEIADAREDCQRSEDHASQLAEKLRSAEESLALSQSLAQRVEEDSRKARSELSQTAGDLQKALSELGELRPKVAKMTDAAETAQKRSEELEAAAATMRTTVNEAMESRARAQADLRTLALEVKRIQRDKKSARASGRGELVKGSEPPTNTILPPQASLI